MLVWLQEEGEIRSQCYKKNDGGWCNIDEEIGEEIAKFYSQLFTSSQPQECEKILSGIPRTIFDQMNLRITQPVEEKEIKDALFSMHPNKAPGPDATTGEAEEITKMIKCYGKASGQEVNMEKSSVFLSKNMDLRLTSEVIKPLNGIQIVSQSKYLGLPLVVGRSKGATLRFIKESLIKRITNWKGKLLSTAGKEVMIKSVATALPAYAMSVFKLPIGMCKELSRTIAKYWWGGKEKEKKIHWKIWQKISKIKGQGRLGFRDLQCFNTALLAKLVWRFLTNSNLLVSKVLKERYFLGSSILKAKNKKGASWIWNSLQSSLEMLESGLRRQVGDGKSISIWHDKWLKNSKTRKILTPRPKDCEFNTVADLIQNQKWKTYVINSLFSEEERRAILDTPLSWFRRKDKCIRSRTKHGFYTTKSGYVKTKEMEEERCISGRQEVGTSRRNKQTSKIWNQLWSLNIKFKVKHFIWKCLHDILPTHEIVHRRIGIGVPWCRRCGEGAESTEHLLFFCRENDLIWKSFPIAWDGLEQYRSNFWDWWVELQQAAEIMNGDEHIAMTAHLLWQIWKSRNNGCFNEIHQVANKLVHNSIEEWLEYNEVVKSKSTVVPKDNQEDSIREVELRELMNQHATIIYTDAAVNSKGRKNGLGIVVKGNDGKIVATWAVPVDMYDAPEVLEAAAIRKSMLKALQEN